MFEPRSPSNAAALLVRKCNLNLFPNEISDNDDDKTADKQSVMTNCRLFFFKGGGCYDVIDVYIS